VTPGFAKPRSELPWLPYESLDRVRIINSHNFAQSGPTILGDEISIWCPSLDDSGNGTTTLNDLFGSNDGTLTNMALSGITSNWIADTDSGGVRAIAVDGTNDRIQVGRQSALPLAFSIWFKPRSHKTWHTLYSNDESIGGPRLLWVLVQTSGSTYTLNYYAGTYHASSAITVPTSSWSHFGMNVSVAGAAEFFFNGSAVGTRTGGLGGTTGSAGGIMGSSGLDFIGFNAAGMFDDFRIFSAEKTLSQYAALASKRGY